MLFSVSFFYILSRIEHVEMDFGHRFFRPLNTKQHAKHIKMVAIQTVIKLTIFANFSSVIISFGPPTPNSILDDLFGTVSKI